MKCDQCYYRVPNMNGDYCCARYIHPKLKKSNHTGPPSEAHGKCARGNTFSNAHRSRNHPRGAPGHERYADDG